MTNLTRRDFRSVKSNPGKSFLPRLGNIRLGIKKISSRGKEYPSEVNYFVVPPEVAAVYGENPKELHIIFPSEDVEMVAPRAYRWYGSKILKCKGNGEVALCYRSELTDGHKLLSGENESGDKHEQVGVKCPCPLLKSKECSIVLDLMVMLPRVSLGGVYQISTRSINNIRRVDDYLSFLQQTFGRFAKLPIRLTREMAETPYINEKDERITGKHWLLKFDLIANMQEAQQFLVDDKKMLTDGLLIAEPQDEDFETSVTDVKDVGDREPPEAEDAEAEAEAEIEDVKSGKPLPAQLSAIKNILKDEIFNENRKKFEEQANTVSTIHEASEMIQMLQEKKKIGVN